MNKKMNLLNQNRLLSMILTVSIFFSFFANVIPNLGSVSAYDNTKTDKISAVGDENVKYKQESSVIKNPYKDVDWSTYKQYKASLHNHTNNSDNWETSPNGSAANVAKDLYRKDYDIVAITDHNFRTPSLSNVNGGLSSSEMTAIETGTYTGTFPSNSAYSGSRTKSGGMIGLENTNEPSQDGGYNTNHDVNTYWADFDVVKDITGPPYIVGDTMENILQKAEDSGGISHINHPGRYTGAVSRSGNFAPNDGLTGAAASNRTSTINKYVSLFDSYSSCVGMEIMSKLDHESRFDRILWDNILKETMPKGRNVWGFSNDDNHAHNQTGYSWNTMLMPSLSQTEVRKAMETGAFYAVARVDRRENINSTLQNGISVMPNEGSSTTVYMLNQSTPSITNIEVVQGDNQNQDATITIEGEDYDSVEWIADGIKIATGNTLNLTLNKKLIGSYVRAQLKSSTGIAYTQPFGFEGEGDGIPTPDSLTAIITPAPITGLVNGTVKTVAGLKLPSVVKITTGRGFVEDASVIWNVADSNYDPILKTEQNFNVDGIITLPELVENPNSISLSVTINVTVDEEVKKSLVSDFGDEWYYFSRTSTEIFDDAFDMSKLSGWTKAPTTIGYGNPGGTPGAPEDNPPLSLATIIPTGAGANQRGTPNHAVSYFKKTFNLPENFEKDDIIEVFGTHRITNLLIIFVNGQEVYRFGAGSGFPQIGSYINSTVPIWNQYRATPANPYSRDFTIEDYTSKDSGYKGNSDGAVALNHAASLTALTDALNAGENIITCAVWANATASTRLWFDLQLDIELVDKGKLPQDAPTTPTLDFKTTTQVALNSIEGAEYSKDDGETWQDSTIFSELTPDTEYNFVARMKETETHDASLASLPLTVTTSKLPQSAPSVPTLSSKTATQIVLNTIDGAEYSKDNGETWQESTTFENLTPDTEYNFVARMKETETHDASLVSLPLTVTTNKLPQSAPSAPTLSSKTTTQIVLNAIDGAEYSINNGETWQDSTTFENLTPDTEYSFIARMKETETHDFSLASLPLTVITNKLPQSAPSVPIFIFKNTTDIMLNPINGAEYSIDNGETWQDIPIFTGLIPDTEYNFIARMKETTTHNASPASAVLTTKTHAETLSKQEQNPPAAPTLSSRTSTQVVLNIIAGAQYRRGNGAWQDSPTFTGLSPDTEYNFTARMKETETHNFSLASSPLSVITNPAGKLNRAKPSAPRLRSKTHNSVTLQSVTNAQYRRGNGKWQTSPIFRGLTPNTRYNFQIRIRETATHNASPASNTFTTTTNRQQLATPKSLKLTTKRATWRNAANNNGYTLRILQGNKVIITAQIRRNTTRFNVPRNLLKKGRTYKFTLIAKGTGRFSNSKVAQSKNLKVK